MRRALESCSLNNEEEDEVEDKEEDSSSSKKKVEFRSVGKVKEKGGGGRLSFSLSRSWWLRKVRLEVVEFIEDSKCEEEEEEGDEGDDEGDNERG